MDQYTTGPFRVGLTIGGHATIESPNDKRYAVAVFQHRGPVSHQDARRLAACLNACEDIETIALEQLANSGGLARIFSERAEYSAMVGKLETERDQLREVCAEAYQFAGAYDAPVEVLDNLSAAANGWPLPHESFLPVMDSEAVAQRDQLLVLLKKFDSIMEGCGNWPDTSSSQVSLGDLAAEVRQSIAAMKGGAA